MRTGRAKSRIHSLQQRQSKSRSGRDLAGSNTSTRRNLALGRVYDLRIH